MLDESDSELVDSDKFRTAVPAGRAGSPDRMLIAFQL